MNSFDDYVKKLQQHFRKFQVDPDFAEQTFPGVRIVFDRPATLTDKELISTVLDGGVIPAFLLSDEQSVTLDITGDWLFTGIRMTFDYEDTRYLKEWLSDVLKYIEVMGRRIGNILKVDFDFGQRLDKTSTFQDDDYVQDRLEWMASKTLPVVQNGSFAAFGVYFKYYGAMLALVNGRSMVIENIAGHVVCDAAGEVVDWVD
ncbi:hypothetical protein [Secundilactobacillus muriivasis]